MGDAEFQESLRKDRQREAQQEEAKRHQEHLELQEAAHAEAAKARRLEALEVKRRRLEEHSEPDVKEPTCCQLRVRLPSGKCLPVRRFRGSDALSLVYDWVDVSCTDDAFTNVGYLLVQQTPGETRREFNDRELTLKEAGVSRQTMMYIAEID